MGITQVGQRELQVTNMGVEKLRSPFHPYNMMFSRVVIPGIDIPVFEYAFSIPHFSGIPDEQEEAYRCFPGVLLAVRYIKEVVSE